jgi:hypothetical protein
LLTCAAGAGTTPRFACLLLLMLVDALGPSLLVPALLASYDRRLLLWLLVPLTRADSACSGSMLLLLLLLVLAPTTGKGAKPAGPWEGRPSTSLLECLLDGTAALPAPAAAALLLLLVVVVLLLPWPGADFDGPRVGLPSTPPAAAMLDTAPASVCGCCFGASTPATCPQTDASVDAHDAMHAWGTSLHSLSAAAHV